MSVIGEGEPLTMSGTGSATPAQTAQTMKMAAGTPDANDVNYDAYLANDRTLNDPEVVKVEKGGRCVCGLSTAVVARISSSTWEL